MYNSVSSHRCSSFVLQSGVETLHAKRLQKTTRFLRGLCKKTTHQFPKYIKTKASRKPHLGLAWETIFATKVHAMTKRPF